MTRHPVPANENDRLRFLRDLEVDFSAPIAELQKVTRIASMIAGTPIALVSLVEEDVQRFAANIGVPSAEGTKRNEAFCAPAMMSSAQLVIGDARQDARFRDNPLVTGAPNVRAYAGSVLEPEQGMRLGTLCVIDTRPREFSAEVLAQLDDLFDAVAALLMAHRDRL